MVGCTLIPHVWINRKGKLKIIIGIVGVILLFFPLIYLNPKYNYNYKTVFSILWPIVVGVTGAGLILYSVRNNEELTFSG